MKSCIIEEAVDAKGCVCVGGGGGDKCKVESRIVSSGVLLWLNRLGLVTTYGIVIGVINWLNKYEFRHQFTCVIDNLLFHWQIPNICGFRCIIECLTSEITSHTDIFRPSTTVFNLGVSITGF